MEVDDEFIFMRGEIAPLEVRPQVVYPPQPATLPTSLQPSSFREGAPAAFAMGADVGDEAVVFLFRPRPFVRVCFLATW